MERARKGAVDILAHDNDLTELFGCGSLLWLIMWSIAKTKASPLTDSKGRTCLLQLNSGLSGLPVQGWLCHCSAYQCVPAAYIPWLGRPIYRPSSTISTYIVSTLIHHTDRAEKRLA